jgi:hypothetical protein
MRRTPAAGMSSSSSLARPSGMRVRLPQAGPVNLTAALRRHSRGPSRPPSHSGTNPALGYTPTSRKNDGALPWPVTRAGWCHNERQEGHANCQSLACHRHHRRCGRLPRAVHPPVLPAPRSHRRPPGRLPPAARPRPSSTTPSSSTPIPAPARASAEHKCEPPEHPENQEIVVHNLRLIVECRWGQE